MEGLNIDNILNEEEFEETPFTIEVDDEEENDNTDNSQDDEDLTADDSDEDQESVSSNEDIEDEDDTFDDEDESDSPNSDFYSSMAFALLEEGVLPNLDEDTIKNIKSPADLRDAINEQIASELNDVQKRIVHALNSGVPADVVKENEGVLKYLQNISDDVLIAENKESQTLRQQLIYQDLINRGYSPSKAEKEVKKSINAGTDIEDAKEALQSNLQFYSNQYKAAIDQAQYNKTQYTQYIQQQIANAKKIIIDDSEILLGELNPDKKTRKKIFDNLTKPAYQDGNTGQYLTPLQKCEIEDPEGFKIAVATLYTLTDGFQSLDRLVDSRAKKEIKKGFKRLESAINNSARDSFGNLNFASGTNDSESYIGKGYKLNI